MVRDVKYRINKWDKKVDALIVYDRFSKLKDIAKEQLDPYLINVTATEKKVKELLEKNGIPTIQIAFYLAYARELLGKTFGSVSEETLRNEELAIRSKWVQRGLEDEKLKEIAKMFGIDPKPLPTAPEIKIFKSFETEEELLDIERSFSPSDAEFIFERSNEWAYDGNYSLKLGGYGFRYVEINIMFPVKIKKFNDIIAILKPETDIENSIIHFLAHEETTNETKSVQIMSGPLEMANYYGLIISKEKTQLFGINWDDVDKIGYRFSFTEGSFYLDYIRPIKL